MRRRRIVAWVVPAVMASTTLVGCSGDDQGDRARDVDFCTTVANFEALQEEGDALFESSEEASVEQMRGVFSRFRDVVQDLRATAPDQIADDAVLVGDTTEALIDAFVAADFDFVALATDAQYADVLAGLDDDRITEANDRLAVFFREECGPG